MSALFDSLLAGFRSKASGAPSQLQSSNLLPSSLSASRLTTTTTTDDALANAAPSLALRYGKTYSVEPERYQSLMERLL